MKKKEYVISLKMEDMTRELLFPQRSKEYMVLESTSDNMQIQRNCHYRASFFGVLLAEEGISYYRVGDFEYELQKGDILFCVPQEVFKIIYFSADIKQKQIFFSIDMLSDAGFNYRSNDMLKNFSNNPSYIIRGEQHLYKRLAFYIKELAYLNDFKNPVYYSNEMIWHYFSLLMYDIENYSKNFRQQASFSSREEEITSAFFALVREYYVEHHDVQFYADRLFVSRKYLTKVVKKAMLRTPKEIINQILLIEAKILLKNSANNVNQVACLLNFSDQTVFSKFFKKHTERNPSDYKMDDLF
ncbi:helix-turn-helix transcriptional regulator [Sphingobacterium sp. ML3W]|uniref:helix-turn-helix transcriptional regulator n=1 Tax=Sphingobacterium sp. ML3W TaxID=1538644 RepID=UPI00249C43CE|nr:helix-turn-helix transcriptional regulator [Sphingobacterium sp. ML3W]WFA81553.1 helix-turn-helix transcriptional regulator [Sphingobacterium sp. ML3W]